MSIDLRAALAPAELDDMQIASVAALLGVLEGDQHAPTAVQGRDLAVYVHLADSLAALDLAAVREASRIADLGSGAGFPGLALAIALPSAAVALVESQRRKCEFLERAIGAAEIANASVVCSRAEGWAEGAAAQDLVTARALAPQAVVLEYAAPLLRVGGRSWTGEELGTRMRSSRLLGRPTSWA